MSANRQSISDQEEEEDDGMVLISSCSRANAAWFALMVAIPYNYMLISRIRSHSTIHHDKSSWVSLSIQDS
jgi:hypothetical protein